MQFIAMCCTKVAKGDRKWKKWSESVYRDTECVKHLKSRRDFFVIVQTFFSLRENVFSTMYSYYLRPRLDVCSLEILLINISCWVEYSHLLVTVISQSHSNPKMSTHNCNDIELLVPAVSSKDIFPTPSHTFFCYLRIISFYYFFIHTSPSPSLPLIIPCLRNETYF